MYTKHTVFVHDVALIVITETDYDISRYIKIMALKQTQPTCPGNRENVCISLTSNGIRQPFEVSLEPSRRIDFEFSFPTASQQTLPATVIESCNVKNESG